MLAGAGTGKTRALTSRLAYLLQSGRARPQEILAVTFTNKAANEMRERVEQILGYPAAGWWLGTFHTLCARLLRRHAELIERSPRFTILDAADQTRVLRSLMDEADLDTKRWPPRVGMTKIQGWKDRGFLPDQVPASSRGEFAGGLLVILPALSGPTYHHQCARFWRLTTALPYALAPARGYCGTLPAAIPLYYG